jgi:hypothetical protein
MSPQRALEQDRPTPDAGKTAVPSAEIESDGTGPRWRRSRAVSIALIAVALLLLAGGVTVFVLPDGAPPSTPLGAAGSAPGGLARVNGILPVESDGWLPPDGSAAFDRPAADGVHRVRILLELTALDAQGIDFSAADYAITGLGSGRPPLVWAEPADGSLRQGESVTATLVFEIPNEAVSLTLVGPGGMRLALGVGHHTPGS